jgi:DNA-binding transcriptional LysR family regulator
LKRGTLSVEASQTIASHWLPRHLVAFRRAYPQIDIRLAMANTAQVITAVETRTTELGFVEGAVRSEQLTSTPVARDQVVVVVSPDHPWVEQTDLTPADILDGEWVLREPGSGTRSVFEDALVKFGVDPAALHIRLELPSNEAVRAAVEAGLGATVISASIAAPSIEAGLLHQVDFHIPAREFYVISHRERCRSRAAEALLEMVTRSRPKSVARP